MDKPGAKRKLIVKTQKATTPHSEGSTLNPSVTPQPKPEATKGRKTGSIRDRIPAEYKDHPALVDIISRDWSTFLDQVIKLREMEQARSDIPISPDDFVVDLPSDVDPEYASNLVFLMKTAAYECKLPIPYGTAVINKIIYQLAERENKRKADYDKEIKAAYGSKLKQVLKIARRAPGLSGMKPELLSRFLKSGFGYDPDFLDFLYRLGLLFEEDSYVSSSGASARFP